jgi:carbon-monoxide dehydrogenase small subunit
MISIQFRVNGREFVADVKPEELLIDFIREHLGLTGTKRSCDIEICGVCTVLLDGKAVSSCALFAFELNGKSLTTIEGVASPEGLHPLQKSFIENGGFQCGFCTPGMILLAKALLDENADPTPEEVREYMDANICRCTGYQMILQSILKAAAEINGKRRSSSMKPD